MMRDLIEKLNQLQLNEAPVQPGERKGISFKLKKLDSVRSQLDDYKNSLYYMGQSKLKLPPELQKEMEGLESKLNKEIAGVESAYNAMYEKNMVNDRPIKMDNLFKALAKNCKEIIKVYKELNRNNFSREKFLYRGIKRSTDDALYGKPFTARKPKDSNVELHDLVNDTINTLGFDANRENAMFVSGDRSQASGYGNLYIMFPVDGFTFTWSKNVKDLILDSGKRMEMIDKNVVNQIREIVRQVKSQSNEPEKFSIDPDDLFYSGYNYQRDKDILQNAVENGTLPDEIKDLLDNILTADSIQSHFDFTDSDIFSAILSEKEIYIKGDYYAVNLDHREELYKFLEEINTDDVELPENFGEVPEILNKGDIVRVLSGTHEGKLGTVTYVYSKEYEVFITNKIGDITLPQASVELYKLPDGSIPLYEKGDEIIVTDRDIKQYGLVAEVVDTYPTKIEIKDKDNNYKELHKNQIALYNSELEQEILKDLETKPPTIENNDLVIVSDPDNEFYKERGKVNYIYSTGTIEVYLQKKDTYIDFQPDQLTLLKNAGPDLIDTPHEDEFNIGDVVQITSGEYHGYYGTVSYLYSNGKKAEVSLTGMDQNVDVWLKDLQHYNTSGKKKEPTEEKPKLNVGDKVKILVGDNAGEEAIVNYISSVFPDEIDVNLVNTGSLKTVPTSGVELVTDEPKQQTTNDIKVGDIVQVSNDESSFYGQTGEVIDTGQTPDGKPWIKFKNETYTSGIKTFVDWVEKLDKQSTQQTFNKNDKFKVKNKSYTVDGATATVLDGPDSDGDYKAVTVDGKIIFTTSSQMEKIEDTEVKLTVGDMVKAIGPSAYNTSSYVGNTGTITSVSDDGKFAGVQFTSDNILTYGTENLEKISDNTTLKIGDNVKINNNSDIYKGEVGKIDKGPDTDGDFVVVFDNGKWAYFNSTMLDKLQPAKDEIDNLTWEPEPEVVKPVPKFSIDDKVEVISQFPSLIGKTGTVMQVHPIYDFVSVQLDGNTEPSSFPSSALKKIDQPTIDTPQQTVNDFNKGDMVEVINSTLSSYGKQGKVTDINPVYLFVDLSTGGESALKPTSVKKIG